MPPPSRPGAPGLLARLFGSADRGLGAPAALLDRMDTGVLVFGADSAPVYANAAAHRLPLPGSPVFADLFGGDADAAAQALARTLDGESLRLWRCIGAGPDAFEAELRLKPLDWRGSRAVFAELVDVGDYRRSERTLVARNAELERIERLAVGRELRMIELKRRVADLEDKLEDLSWKEGPGAGDA